MHVLLLFSALLLSALATGCLSPPRSELPVSSHFAEPQATTGGRRLAAQAAEHPGDSGLYVLGSGLDAFAARVLLIDRAERAVDAQYYIFHDDLTGRFLLSRMLRAADRGVRVRLLIDDLGSWNIDPLLAGLAAHEQQAFGAALNLKVRKWLTNLVQSKVRRFLLRQMLQKVKTSRI